MDKILKFDSYGVYIGSEPAPEESQGEESQVD
jgi:hypothetical protein